MSDILSAHKKNFTLFLEAGFIAVNESDEDSAIKLFQAANWLNPKSPLPTIGMGYLSLCKLELKQAATMFKEAIRIDPSNEMAKAFLGICLSLTTNEVTEGEKILEEHTRSSDKDIAKLSADALKFVEDHVKKTKPTDLR